MTLPTPTAPICVQASHDSLTVTWSLGVQPNDSRIEYELYYKEAESNPSAKRKLALVHSPTSMATIDGLKADVDYEIKVRCKTSSSDGPFSPITKMHTSPISPPVAPSLLQISPTAVRVTITPPAVMGDNVTILTYTLQCYDISESTKLHTVQMISPSAPHLQTDVELEREKLYNFKVRVHCATDNIDSATTGTFQLDKGILKSNQSPDSGVEMMECTDDAQQNYPMSNGMQSSSRSESCFSQKRDDYDRCREQSRMAARGANTNQVVAGGNSIEADRMKARTGKKLKDQVLRDSRIVGGCGNTNIHQINLDEVYASKTQMLYKYQVGQPQPGSPEKVIMIVGATGSGKTTLINAMINYVMGVDYEDKYRLRLIMEDQSAANQAKSQTQNITAYTIHPRDGANIAYTLTVIDTPGFGDTSGIQRDQLIAQQIKEFFSTQGRGGIDHIDAIGFVVQASLPRLTPAQTYVFDAILSLFGNDIADNIFLMVTFADGQRPPVLAGVKEANMTYKKYYKFNNSAVFPDETEEPMEDGEMGDFNQMFWTMGFKSFEKFLNDLKTVTSKSLLLTKSVLDERNRLELYVTKIHEDIKHGLNQLEQLRVEIGVLKDNAAEIDRNKDFTYTVVEDIMVKHDTPTGQHTTNCLTCNHTCHTDCMIPDDGDKENCVAINANGYCTMCPGNCIWNVHKNLPYVIVVEQQSTTKTAQDLKNRYEEAMGGKLDAEQLVAAVTQDFETTQQGVLDLTEKVRDSLRRLQEIALKPNPLSCLDYIDLLIQSEENEGRPGWQDRVGQLRGVRARAEYLQNVTVQRDYDPFEKYKKEVQEDFENSSDAGSDSVWSSVSKQISPSTYSD